MKNTVRDLYKEEKAARERGFLVVAGIDEAGRGPLAGPVVASCVILPEGCPLPGVDDSKKLSPAARDRAYDSIREKALAIGIGRANAAVIDEMNILRATHHAMRLALADSSIIPDFVLIDGLAVHPFPLPSLALVKGDSRSLSIAAASIIAKVTRDRMMVEYDLQYPQYDFAGHKGYPTAMHMRALEEHGACPIHRRSFGPVKRVLAAEPSGPQQTLSFQLNVVPIDMGMIGEEIVCKHLQGLGWEILDNRYHCHGGELDIVGRTGDMVVFVEVKTRSSRLLSAAESVDKRKRSRICLAAMDWIVKRVGNEIPYRYDVAEVYVGSNGLYSVRLIENAFMEGE